MSAHPPPIPPIGVRRPPLPATLSVPEGVWHFGQSGLVYADEAEGLECLPAWVYTVPLALDPAQPARCGGTET